MSIPPGVKIDRIEKRTLELIDMIGRLDSGLNARIDAVDAKVESLRTEMKQMRADQANTHKEAMMRFITYEEDLRRLRMEFRMLDERMRALESKSEDN